MSPHHFRVLLVEDDADDVDMTREALKEAKLYVDLRVARDGEAAMRYLRREGEFADAPAPDLIFLDLNLPGIDGREVLRRIKENESFKQIPVIVLTTSGADADILRTYKLHANAYVRKPVGLETFIEAVHAIESFWLTVAKLPPHTT